MRKPSQPSSQPSKSSRASDEYLSELFGVAPEESPAEPAIALGTVPVIAQDGSFDPYVTWIDIELLDDNPYQSRNIIFKQPLEGLIASINDLGQIQAATARPHPTRSGRFQLCVGHRRKNAVKQGANAGIKLRDPHNYIGKLRVEVSRKDDTQMLDEVYAENEDREPHSIFDRAAYYIMLRELETRRFHGMGLTPVSSETARKRAGAAVTSDGLVSWEELVAIRKREGKPLPGARTLRRIVGVLDLEAALRDRLAAINLADPNPEGDDKESAFKGVTEKHCSAVKLLAGHPTKQSQLVEEIAAQRLSANEAEIRARALRDAGDGITLNHIPAGEEPNTQGEQGAGAAPPDPGAANVSGNSHSGKAESKTNRSQSGGKGKPGQAQDLVAAFVAPAVQGLTEAARIWPELRVGNDYRQRLLGELDELDARSAKLRNILTASESEKIKREQENPLNRNPAPSTEGAASELPRQPTEGARTKP